MSYDFAKIPQKASLGFAADSDTRCRMKLAAGHQSRIDPRFRIKLYSKLESSARRQLYILYITLRIEKSLSVMRGIGSLNLAVSTTVSGPHGPVGPTLDSASRHRHPRSPHTHTSRRATSKARLQAHFSTFISQLETKITILQITISQ